MRKAEALALGMSALISGIASLFAPIVWFLTISTNTVLRLPGIDPNAEDDSPEAKVPLIETVDSKTWKIHGDALLVDVSRALGVTLPVNDYATFNGLIFGALCTIPQDGSSVEVETAGLVIKVTEIRDHQVETALVCLENPVSAKDDIA